MADPFLKKPIDLNKINGGNRYRKDSGVSAEAINDAIEASAYAQEITDSVKGLADNQPNIAEANQVGEPSVEIEETADGSKRFVFKNLKGATGATGRSVYRHELSTTPSLVVIDTNSEPYDFSSVFPSNSLEISIRDSLNCFINDNKYQYSRALSVVADSSTSVAVTYLSIKYSGGVSVIPSAVSIEVNSSTTDTVTEL